MTSNFTEAKRKSVYFTEKEMDKCLLDVLYKRYCEVCAEALHSFPIRYVHMIRDYR